MARAFQLLARSEQFDWFFLSRYSADQFALGFSVQCHFTMCKLFLAAADGEQINSRNQLEEVSTAAWKVIIVSVFTFQKEGIWFGGLIKVSFSQQRQHPNPKVWNMDCGAAAAAYHYVSYPFGSGRHKSINLAFSLSQKLILVGSQEVRKVITRLFQIQKAVSLIISESKWWLLSEIKEEQPRKEARRYHLSSSFPCYLS